MSDTLAPAAKAFDAIAEQFDERFGAWESVAAQRRAVRAELARAFPPGSRVLELGGGTGVDAEWLVERGRSVQLTDPSPTMVAIAGERLRPYGAPQPVVCGAEHVDRIGGKFDGAFSNFAGLNCVEDMSAMASRLGTVIRPGGRVLLVMFGRVVPGEWLVQLLRGRPRQMFRRFTGGSVRARVSGNEFSIWYHSSAELERAFAPHFRLVGEKGIGVFVPPSDAEPWITRYPRVLNALEWVDRQLARPLSVLGDHILYEFERT